MADVTRIAASVDASTAQIAPQITGKKAGENLTAGDACYINPVDGLVYRSNGTAANTAARVHGFVPRNVTAGQPCTLYGPSTRFRYGSGLGKGGDPLYLSATPGALSNTKTTGGQKAVAFTFDDNDVYVAAYVAD